MYPDVKPGLRRNWDRFRGFLRIKYSGFKIQDLRRKTINFEWRAWAGLLFLGIIKYVTKGMLYVFSSDSHKYRNNSGLCEFELIDLLSMFYR